MSELRQREWIVAFKPQCDQHEVKEEVVHAPKWWDVPMALYKIYPEGVIQGIWAIMSDWPTDEELEGEAEEL